MPPQMRPPMHQQHPAGGHPFPGSAGPVSQPGYPRPLMNPASSSGSAAEFNNPAYSQPPYSSGNMPPPAASVYTGGPPPPAAPLPASSHAGPPFMGPGQVPAQSTSHPPPTAMQMSIGSPHDPAFANPASYGGQMPPSGSLGQSQGSFTPGSQSSAYGGKNLPPSSGGALPTQPQQPRRLDPDQMPSPVSECRYAFFLLVI